MKLLILAIIQSLFLCAGQVCMKLALKAAGNVCWTWQFLLSQLTNFWWLASGMTFTVAGLMWMYILKHWAFSQAYPLSSIAYIFGMMAAMFIFNEHIAWTQWVGVLLIMAGCYLVTN